MLYFELIDPSRQIAGSDFHVVRSFLKSTGRTQIGWHYITDLTWLYSKIKQWPESLKLLDAGGGSGPLQFLLAEMGYSVTNVDMNLKSPSNFIKDRYAIALNKSSESFSSGYKEFLNFKKHRSQYLGCKKSFRKFKRYLQNNPIWKFFHHIRHNHWRHRYGYSSIQIGKISWTVGNLCNLKQIPTGSFDGVVSLSALEHIPTNQLTNAISEIQRVLKDNRYWAVTTSATHEKTSWFHDPSKGYCYSISDIEKFFEAKNTSQYKPIKILEAYKHCDYLRNNLAKFYFKSADYGMPWGIWDPKYIPAGIYS